MGLIRDVVAGGLCLALFLILWSFMLGLVTPTTLAVFSLEGFLMTYGDVVVIVAAVITIGVAVPIRDFIERLGKRRKNL